MTWRTLYLHKNTSTHFNNRLPVWLGSFSRNLPFRDMDHARPLHSHNILLNHQGKPKYHESFSQDLEITQIHSFLFCVQCISDLGTYFVWISLLNDHIFFDTVFGYWPIYFISSLWRQARFYVFDSLSMISTNPPLSPLQYFSIQSKQISHWQTSWTIMEVKIHCSQLHHFMTVDQWLDPRNSLITLTMGLLLHLDYIRLRMQSHLVLLINLALIK